MKRALFLLFPLLAACLSHGADTVRAAELRAAELAATTSPSGEVAATAQNIGADWWTALEDHQLNTLIAVTQTQSLDISKALARAEEARALVRSGNASLWPTIGLGVSSEDASRGASATEIGLDSFWQIDLFGQARTSLSAAKARAGSAEALAEDVRRLVIADIVSTYLTLSAVEADIALSRQSETRLVDALDKITRLTEAGYGTALDRQRSARQLLDVQSRTSQLEGRANALRNALTLSIGQAPGTLSLSPTPLMNRAITAGVTAPDPETFLQDRPDIRAAHAALMAAAFDTDAARKGLLPNLSLSARIFETDANRTVFDFAGLQNELALRLAQPLLFRGRQLAAIDGNDARLKQAALDYEQILLVALSEVDTALGDINHLRQSAAQADRATDAARTALAQSRRLFDAGEIGYLDVLFAEQSLIEADRTLLATKREAALAWARYMTALAIN